MAFIFSLIRLYFVRRAVIAAMLFFYFFRLLHTMREYCNPVFIVFDDDFAMLSTLFFCSRVFFPLYF